MNTKTKLDENDLLTNKRSHTMFNKMSIKSKLKEASMFALMSVIFATVSLIAAIAYGTVETSSYPILNAVVIIASLITMIGLIHYTIKNDFAGRGINPGILGQRSPIEQLRKR